MDTLIIRQKLHQYIDVAGDKRIEEMYAGIQNEVAEPYEWWNDEQIITELDRRSADLKSGKDKGVPWEEVKDRLLNKLTKK